MVKVKGTRKSPKFGQKGCKTVQLEQKVKNPARKVRIEPNHQFRAEAKTILDFKLSC